QESKSSTTSPTGIPGACSFSDCQRESATDGQIERRGSPNHIPPEERPISATTTNGNSREVSESPRSVRLNHGGELTGLRKTVLEPVRIDSTPPDMVHPSTMQECEAIIQQLFNVNSLQTQELCLCFQVFRLPKNRISSRNKEYFLSNKMYPLSQIYLSFPRPSRPGVVLPGLKQSLSSNAANRQKRLLPIHRHHFQQGFR
uniref:Coiled coil protein 74 C-terminal domain-containing protein n=1 Tax=Xiphophorus couchianus TaxID=32473 RepID=A0A3B5L7Y1_9TELE